MAYNHSIYLMVGMPYLLLSVVGVLIYRGCKKNEQFLKARAATKLAAQALPLDGS